MNIKRLLVSIALLLSIWHKPNLVFAGITSAEKRSFLLGNKCALSFDLAQPISPEARIYNEAFAVQQKLKLFTQSRAERMNTVLLANRATLPVLRKIISEIKMRTKYSSSVFPLVIEVSENGTPKFQNTTLQNALKQLETVIESDFRVGFFSLYVEQILLMDAISLGFTVPGMSNDNGGLMNIINQFYHEYLVRLDQGLLALPWANEFSLEEFSFTITRGIYALGISSEEGINFDGLFLGDNYYHSRHYFWRHDLAHLSLIVKFLLLPENSWQKNLIRKMEEKIGSMNDLERSEFLPLWFYWYHESAFMYQLANFNNPNFALNSYLAIHDKNLLVTRFTRPFDLSAHIPIHIGISEEEIKEYVFRVDEKIRLMLIELIKSF